MMEQIQEALAFYHAGDHATARERLAALWDGADGNPLHRCVIAHFLADVQHDPYDELQWDLRALQAADSLTDEHVQACHPSLAANGFYPSLHLNLADDYHRMGATAEARRHLVLARQALDALPRDGFSDYLRGGVARLEAQLETQPDSAGISFDNISQEHDEEMKNQTNTD